MNPRDLFVDKLCNFTPIHTRVDRILKLGEKHDASFTFFVTAENVTSRNDEILETIVDQGHEIGSHSYAHVDFQHIDRDSARSQIERSLTVLDDYYDVQGFRAPYLTANEAAVDAARDLGLRYSSSNRGDRPEQTDGFWTLPVTRPQDAELLHSNEHTLAEVKALWAEWVGPGEVLLFHPWRLGADRFVDALADMLSESCDFLTMSEFIQGTSGCCITFDFDFLQQRQVYEHTARHLYRSPHIKETIGGWFGSTAERSS
jgi:peptidoglycan/xylan/chitin deacetylase (PgdA/CDA1 family)